MDVGACCIRSFFYFKYIFFQTTTAWKNKNARPLPSGKIARRVFALAREIFAREKRPSSSYPATFSQVQSGVINHDVKGKRVVGSVLFVKSRRMLVLL